VQGIGRNPDALHLVLQAATSDSAGRAYVMSMLERLQDLKTGTKGPKKK